MKIIKHKQKYEAAVFFESQIVVRIKDDELKKALKIIRKNRDKYVDLSQYVRCAIIKLNREEPKR